MSLLRGCVALLLTAVFALAALLGADATMQAADAATITKAKAPYHRVIKGTPGPDKVTGTRLCDRIYTGKGRDVIRAVDGRRDLVYAGKGFDTVAADRIDTIRGAERIIYPARQPAPKRAAPLPDPLPVQVVNPVPAPRPDDPSPAPTTPTRPSKPSKPSNPAPPQPDPAPVPEPPVVAPNPDLAKLPVLVDRSAPQTFTFKRGEHWGMPNDGWLMVSARRHLYLRYVVSFPNNFQFGPEGHGFKMPGLGEQANGAFVPTGGDYTTGGWSGRLQADTLGTQARLAGYVYWNSTPKATPVHTVQTTGGYGAILRPRSGGIMSAGGTYTVEVESYRNDPGQSNGLYRVRLNGATVVEDTAARMVDTRMDRSCAIYLFYFGGTNTSPQDQSLTVRDFVLRGE